MKCPPPPSSQVITSEDVATEEKKVLQIDTEPKTQDETQEEMTVPSGTHTTSQPSTSQECRDMLDYMFSEISTLQSNKTITLEEEGFSLPPCDIEDNITIFSELLPQVNVSVAPTSQKRQINTSTESSTGILESESGDQIDSSSIPVLEEQRLISTQGVVRESQQEGNDVSAPFTAWLPRKKKKKKVKT